MIARRLTREKKRLQGLDEKNTVRKTTRQMTRQCARASHNNIETNFASSHPSTQSRTQEAHAQNKPTRSSQETAAIESTSDSPRRWGSSSSASDRSGTKSRAMARSCSSGSDPRHEEPSSSSSRYKCQARMENTCIVPDKSSAIYRTPSIEHALSNGNS